ncbi:MAG: transporter substrate-binding domain-containing protein [Thermodesulfobacteriota bacterium]
MYRQVNKLLWLLPLIFCFIGQSSATADTDRNIVRLTTGEWPPYTSSHMAASGIGSQVVSEAFRLAGYEVEYGFFPWKRSYRLAVNGKWDGSIIWQRTPERARKLLFSDPVVMVKNVFFHHKDDPFDWNNLADLKGRRVGTTRGYAYGPDFRAELARLQIDRADSDSDLINLNLLLKGRIDVFPIDIHVGHYLIARNFRPGEAELFAFHPRPLTPAPLFLVLAKSLPRSLELVEAFNDGLKKLRQSGRYQEILSENLPSNGKQ